MPPPPLLRLPAELHLEIAEYLTFPLDDDLVETCELPPFLAVSRYFYSLLKPLLYTSFGTTRSPFAQASLLTEGLEYHRDPVQFLHRFSSTGLCLPNVPHLLQVAVWCSGSERRTYAITEWLLKQGCSPWDITEWPGSVVEPEYRRPGSTTALRIPLASATRTGYPSVVRLLLSHMTAHPNGIIDWQTHLEPALMIATRRKFINPAIIDILLTAIKTHLPSGDIPEEPLCLLSYVTWAHQCIHHKVSDEVLLRSDLSLFIPIPPTPVLINLALLEACIFRNLAAITRLLAAGADVTNRWLLLVAMPHPDTLALLIDAGADISQTVWDTSCDYENGPFANTCYLQDCLSYACNPKDERREDALQCIRLLCKAGLSMKNKGIKEGAQHTLWGEMLAEVGRDPESVHVWRPKPPSHYDIVEIGASDGSDLEEIEGEETRDEKRWAQKKRAAKRKQFHAAPNDLTRGDKSRCLGKKQTLGRRHRQKSAMVADHVNILTLRDHESSFVV
ncbi:hypothetical protein EDC01DRAFT_15010 [Geopyxis carbonaria]|nr:hypothetical protein EDC01DRAFT_15010 [Geopyxis carbonaria]